MTIDILKKEDQVRGSFDGGRILENKPVGFPQEGGRLRPYSNLFYWANAWSDEGGLIDTHPHQGFEIMSFVIEGEIEHFDTKNNKWFALGSGGAQIIRAGSGISHAERLNPGGRMFQIWFDPNLEESLNEDASYDDYKHEDFPVEKAEGRTTKTYKGDGAPIGMKTPGVSIYEISFDAGKHKLELNDGVVYSAYVLDGSIEIDGYVAIKDDFIKIDKEKKLELSAESESKLFIIENPADLEYKTYLERFGR